MHIYLRLLADDDGNGWWINRIFRRSNTPTCAYDCGVAGRVQYIILRVRTNAALLLLLLVDDGT